MLAHADNDMIILWFYLLPLGETVNLISSSTLDFQTISQMA